MITRLSTLSSRPAEADEGAAHVVRQVMELDDAEAMAAYARVWARRSAPWLSSPRRRRRRRRCAGRPSGDRQWPTRNLLEALLAGNSRPAWMGGTGEQRCA